MILNFFVIKKQSATADGVFGATSNLVLKGIMGIYAMGQINKVLEARGADLSLTLHYLVSFSCHPVAALRALLKWIANLNQDTARNFAQQWRNSVLTPDHVLSAYGNNASWGLLYNLYAPRLLGADIIPEEVININSHLMYPRMMTY